MMHCTVHVYKLLFLARHNMPFFIVLVLSLFVTHSIGNTMFILTFYCRLACFLPCVIVVVAINYSLNKTTLFINVDLILLDLFKLLIFKNLD